MVNAGAFGGLLDRTRIFDEMDKSSPEEMVNQHNQHGSELWVSKEMIEAEERIEFEEHNSAELIYDEIGLGNDEDAENQDIEEIMNQYAIKQNNENKSMQNLIDLL